MALKEHAGDDIAAARAYVDAMLGLEVWAHTLHDRIVAEPHAHVNAHQRQ